MIILGIDPGNSRIGYGIIADTPRIILQDAGLIEITPKNIGGKLEELHIQLSRLIKKYKPDLLALETLFFSKNKTTALQVAEARGVILFTAYTHTLPVCELNPMSIKKTISGSGSADKQTVARVIERLLQTKLPAGPDDISDAVAIALAGLLRSPQFPSSPQR